MGNLLKHSYLVILLSISTFSNAQTTQANISEPLNVSIVPGNQSLTISWSPPLDTGGEIITGYVAAENRAVILGSPPIKRCSTGSPSITTCTITGLTNGENYAISVNSKTINSIGRPSKTIFGTPNAPTAVPLFNNVGLIILSFFLLITLWNKKIKKYRKNKFI